LRNNLNRKYIKAWTIIYLHPGYMSVCLYVWQDVSDSFSLQYPKLYTPGPTNQLFNKQWFGVCAFEGILSSLVLFFIPYLAFDWGINPQGKDIADHKSFGYIVATILIVVVTIRVCISVLFCMCTDFTVIFEFLLLQRSHIIYKLHSVPYLMRVLTNMAMGVCDGGVI